VVRWDRASSRVVCAVAWSSASTKSSMISEDTGVSQLIGTEVDLLSSITRDAAAAVKALVMLQVEKSEWTVVGSSGNSAIPYACVCYC
jgi:hypothetical protein